MGGSSGGGSSPPSNTTTTQKIELPKYAQPYAKDLLTRGAALSNEPYSAYPGDKIAGFTPEHELALQGITNRAIFGSPDISAARGNMANTLSGAYMDPNSNPWLSKMMDQAGGQIVDQYRKGTAAQLDKMSSMGNAFGGSAYREMVNDNSSTLGRTLSDAADQIYYKNYADERLAQQRAMTLAPQMANLDYQDAQALLGVGDVRRGYSQDILNTNYGNWLDAQQYPYKQLDVLANSIRGSVGGGGTITRSAPNPYVANPTMNMLGGGLLGYGASQSLGIPSWMGAAGGALLGGLAL